MHTEKAAYNVAVRVSDKGGDFEVTREPKRIYQKSGRDWR